MTDQAETKYSESEQRPQNCRNRLRDEGQAYPKSGCEACKTGGMTGCPHEDAEKLGLSTPTNTALIPTLNGQPEITNRMKAECIGEFRFDIEVPGLNEYDEVTGEMEIREVVVPWDLCKKIYKTMASFAMLSNASNSKDCAKEFDPIGNEAEYLRRRLANGDKL